MTSIYEDLVYALDPVAFCADRLGLTLDPWQRQLFLDERNTIVNACRQSGKTTTAAALATYLVVNFPSSLILALGPVQRQSQILFAKISANVKSLEPVQELEEDNRLSLTLKNGSRVIALPGDNPDNLRGFSAPKLIIVDEAAFVDDGVFTACVPMLGVSRGRLILISSPNGARGQFWTIWNEPSDQWAKIRITADDCPRLDKGVLEQARLLLPQFRFRAEYYGEFLDGASQIFGSELIRSAIDDEIPPLFGANELEDLMAVFR